MYFERPGANWVVSFRHGKVLPAEEDHGFASPKEHLCHSQHRSGRVSHRRDHATQLCRSATACLFKRHMHKVDIKRQDCQGDMQTSPLLISCQ